MQGLLILRDPFQVLIMPILQLILETGLNSLTAFTALITKSRVASPDLVALSPIE